VTPQERWTRPPAAIPAAIFLITRELRTALDRRMASHGLTWQQASLLIRCVQHPGASPNRLMPHLRTDKAGISRLADRLEAAGLVKRVAGGDRRSICLWPTRKGLALAPKLEGALRAINEHLVTGLSDRELAGAAEMLHRLLAAARRLNAHDGSSWGHHG
jgi:DNA-binding MarR family transcriptional regulator